MNFLSRMKQLFLNITVEPAIFLQTFSWGLQMVISQNLIIDKVCRDLGYDPTVCKELEHHSQEQDQVEKRAATINMYLSILSALPSIVLALFVGPWSDINGRKPLMLLPLIGYMITEIMWILNVYFWDWPADHILSTCLYSFFGGFTCFLIGLYAYLSDITTTRSRTTRIAVLEVCLFVGIPSGTFASAYVFDTCGYYGVFGIVLVCQFLSCLYLLLFITDTKGEITDTHTDTILRRYLSVVDYRHVADVFRTTFKRRDHKLRRVILLLILLMLLNVTVFSDSSIFYLFARRQFSWTEQQFTKFQTLIICFSMAASLIVMPLLSYYLSVHDAMIGILATMSKICSLVVISLASDGYILFFGASLGCISTLSSIVIRSMLSKCVLNAELGKIFSLLASFEAAVPLLATPLFTAVFNATLQTWPGATFMVEAAIFLVGLVLFTYVFYLLTRIGQDLSVLVGHEEDQAILVDNQEEQEDQGVVPANNQEVQEGVRPGLVANHEFDGVVLATERNGGII